MLASPSWRNTAALIFMRARLAHACFQAPLRIMSVPRTRGTRLQMHGRYEPSPMNHRPPRQATRRDEFRALRAITTRWMDNDQYGHVNNVVYYSYFDTAVNALPDRGQWLRHTPVARHRHRRRDELPLSQGTEFSGHRACRARARETGFIQRRSTASACSGTTTGARRDRPLRARLRR